MVSWTGTISKWVKQREVKFVIHPQIAIHLVRFTDQIQLHIVHIVCVCV